MVGESRKWMILVAAIWIQAFTGTNFDFSSYSSTLKTVLGISQVQLNYLSMASDMGKAFGWCSGVCLLHFPLWLVLFTAAFLGFFGYGLQWLVIKQVIILPYILVFVLCLMAGCSICWFNTVCYVLCIRNFHTNKALALSLTVSFNGLSAAVYTVIANAINPADDTLYLFSNALVPLLVSMLAILPILCQPTLQQLSGNAVHRESIIFFLLNILAVVTGLYLLLLNSQSFSALRTHVLLGGAILLLFLPLCLPGVMFARVWTRRTIQTSFRFDNSEINLDDNDDLELFKELIEGENDSPMNGNTYGVAEKEEFCSCFGRLLEKDRLTMLGEEHTAQFLVRRWDFWLYYIAYFCGGTIGLVYSNNLGQIVQSLGHNSKLNSLVIFYSACSFFGRLLSAAPDFLGDKMYFARTGWLAIALLPTPIAFSLLVASGSVAALHASTALIGLSSGFLFSAAVAITSELFGPNSTGVNHNILITNIPLGSLLYGLLAATNYDLNAGKTGLLETLLGEATLCMGRQCYLKTFIFWGCISLVGLVASFVLFLRTRPAYDCFERNRNRTQFS